ncbi:MAG: 3-dehydroquinate synthase [Planctomycetaceae bacterium]
MGFASVHVALGDRSYEIVIASDAHAGLPEVVEGWWRHRGLATHRKRLAVIVTDENVREPHAARVAQSLQQAGWRSDAIVLPPGEQTKSQSFLTAIYDRLVDLHADRQTLIVAVGGGVIGDLAGFAAATYGRGVPFVQVPTTLLAQVDSSVGGKVAINHPRGKNLIGAFYQPLGVLIDTAVLSTLPDRDYRSGLAEVAKYGVILDAEFFEFLEQNVSRLATRDAAALRQVIGRSCSLKAMIVERDEYEQTGLRSVLNYGHTFGHAFEALYGYGEMQHGEAVAIGMTCAARLAERLKRIDAAVTQRQTALLAALGLPVELPEGGRPEMDAILEAMRLDKKSVGGELRFVLPTRLGQVDLVPVDDADVRAVLGDCG